MIKSIDKIFLKEIQKINLRGIKFEEVNNKIVPIVSGATLIKGGSERLKVLLYLAKLISEGKEKTIKEIVFYLEKSLAKQIETLKIINAECEREPLIKNIISNEDHPYTIEEIQKELEKDPYSITNEDGTITNILFEFIQKVSLTTKFIFSDKQPRLIGINITAIKKTIKQSSLTLEQLEWYFDKVYTKFIYDGFSHKSIRGFLLEAEDYYGNTDHNQKVIKGLMQYLRLKKEPTTPLAIGVAFKKHKGPITSIMENIGWNDEVFTTIIKDFAQKSKSQGLNWTVNTVFNNLFIKYGKYIVTEKNIENKDNTKKEKEFTDFIELKSIKDEDIIIELYTIYQKDGIQAIINLI